MKDVIVNLLKSKRVWGFAVLGVVWAFKHYAGGWDPCAEAQSLVSDQNLLGAGGIWAVITKLIDSAKG